LVPETVAGQAREVDGAGWRRYIFGMIYLAYLALFALAFFGMEGVAWLAHRYLMHGPLWVLHRSHHEPRDGTFEANDLFAVFFALPAALSIYLGIRGLPLLLPVGLGVTAYGMVYFVFHDGLVHRRFPIALDPHSRFWRPRVQAHRLHHAVRTRTGCVSFGFLWALPIRALKIRLDATGALQP
jgi:beta-carotene 3-hydroxylase